MRVQDTGYLGNDKLKRTRVPISWTPELLEEFIKCQEDPIYFSEKYIKIVHVDRGLIPIVLYDYQKEIIVAFNENRRTAVVTSRQAGKTTTAAALILHYILFNEHKTVALLANKGDAAREILDRIKLAYEALPKWMQSGIVTWNKGSIELENGCKVIAAATSSSAIRGKSVSLLYIDECVGGDTEITVRNKHTGEVSSVRIEDFYKYMKGANRDAVTSISSSSDE